jgi:hypothetical protein
MQRGSRHKASLMVEFLLQAEAGNLTARCIELALAGNVLAMKLCMERILAPARPTPVEVERDAELDLTLAGLLRELLAIGRTAAGSGAYGAATTAIRAAAGLAAEDGNVSEAEEEARRDPMGALRRGAEALGYELVPLRAARQPGRRALTAE